MPSFFPPARLAPKKRGDTITRYLLFFIKQTEWKIFKCRYLLLYLLPFNPSLPSHSSRGMKQGQGREACTVRTYVCYGKIVAGIYIDTCT